MNGMDETKGEEVHDEDISSQKISSLELYRKKSKLNRVSTGTSKVEGKVLADLAR
jgi:hypothetical protein